MSELDGLIDPTRLFEDLCRIEYLKAGFKDVKRNKGSPGIDGMTITGFESNLNEELRQLQEELSNWTYKPSPVRRVEIPKPGGKGIRLLGVPTIKDSWFINNQKQVIRSDKGLPHWFGVGKWIKLA